MAHFIITTPAGQSYPYEGSLMHAQKEMHKHGVGASMQLIHPGTSGHGTSGLDY